MEYLALRTSKIPARALVCCCFFHELHLHIQVKHGNINGNFKSTETALNASSDIDSIYTYINLFIERFTRKQSNGMRPLIDIWKT